MTDLSGINAIPLLEELYLAFNDVTVLDDFTFHDNIQVIDLEANRITSVEEVSNLATCPMVNCLTLSGNPVVENEGDDYRRKVLVAVSTLLVLDDVEVSSSDHDQQQQPTQATVKNAWSSGCGNNTESAEDDESNFVCEAIKNLNDSTNTNTDIDGHHVDNDDSSSKNGFLRKRPQTAGPSLSRYKQQESPSSQNSDKLLKLLRLSQFSPNNSSNLNSPSSSLTYGGSTHIAGDAARGLRQFNSSGSGSPISRLSATYTQRIVSPEASDNNAEVEYEVAGDQESFKSAIAELKSWRFAHGTSMVSSPGGTLLKIKSSKNIDDSNSKTEQNNSRPGTAPSAINYNANVNVNIDLNLNLIPTEDFVKPSTPSTNSEWGSESCGDRSQLNSRESYNSYVRESFSRDSRRENDFDYLLTSTTTPSKYQYQNQNHSNINNDLSFTSPEVLPGQSPTTPNFIGQANYMEDDELISMLRKKPKEVQQMRTRNSFKKFFSGMPKQKLENLLKTAYSELGDEAFCNAKVNKRIAMMQILN